MQWGFSDTINFEKLGQGYGMDITKNKYKYDHTNNICTDIEKAYPKTFDNDALWIHQ